MTEAREIAQASDVEALVLLSNLGWLECDGRPNPDALSILAAHRIASTAALEAELASVREDRDLWKQSESACNAQFNKLQAERDALREALFNAYDRFQYASRMWHNTQEWYSEDSPVYGVSLHNWFMEPVRALLEKQP